LIFSPKKTVDVFNFLDYKYYAGGLAHQALHSRTLLGAAGALFFAG